MVQLVHEGGGALGAPPGTTGRSTMEWLVRRAESVVIPLGAVLVGLALFGVFLLIVRWDSSRSLGAALDEVWTAFELMYTGGFGTAFSIQNTLSRAAPLLLAALCVALPARLGLVVIGGEGAIVLGGLAAAVAANVFNGAPGFVGIPAMAIAGAIAGGLWIGAIGALRHYRGVNETIASLLMAYIAIALLNHFVEGPLRDPASLNKPSTAPIADNFWVGPIPGMDVHWGLIVGIVGCVLAWILIDRTTWGFSARIAGGNVRAAQIQGLPVGRLILVFTALGGAFAGLAGMFEVAAVQGSANGSLNVGYGYTGILIAFLARHNPLAIIPFGILLGGIEASNGLLQRRLGLPDASVDVLEGILFVVVLLSETLYGRFRIFNPELRGSRA
ncbi:MAG: ABC transporter permease [Bauldia sp.]|nr:ABC transporter permease [Bauldia sp.]